MSSQPQGVVGPVDEMLAQVHRSLLERTDGDVATYIPELALAPADAFGISLATLDGHVYETGDSRLEFTIQSVSKPFVYALALADRGLESVLQKIGVEPTGNPFNSITVDPETGRPYNPMVNAGAIVAASLVDGRDADDRFERIRAALSTFAGRELELDDTVFKSELETGDRNRAIAYFARTNGALEGDVDDVLEVYFKQCSLLVTARDLSVMSATLANGGRNPVTGEIAVDTEHVSRVLAVMSTCGMYDYAGEWMYRVGLPAKSGVSGGIAVALSQRLGIGLYSPRLDKRGNSVRGIAACEDLSQRLGLHVLRADVHSGPPALRRRSGDQMRSKRARPTAHAELLDERGSQIALYELLSDQTFITAETLLRMVLAERDCRWLIVDLRRVTQADTSASTLLTQLVRGRAADGLVTAVVATPDLPVRTSLVEAGAVAFHDPDAALEWAESALLAANGAETDESKVELADQEFLADLDTEGLRILGPLMFQRTFPAGSVIFDQGDPADAIYFVLSGHATVVLRTADPDRWTRLMAVPAGAAFGEIAALDGGTRTSRVVADTDLVALVLTITDLNALAGARADVVGQLYQGIAKALARRLRNSVREILALQA